MDTLEATLFLKFLQTLGLGFSEKSGGYLGGSLSIEGFQFEPSPKLNLTDGTSIELISSDLFMKTLCRTENTLKLKLFH